VEVDASQLYLLQAAKQSSITDHSSLISKKKRDVVVTKKAPVIKSLDVRSAQEAAPVSTERELAPGIVCTSEIAETELRAFDICTRYGPCMSLTRTQRFDRAKRLGLNPPERIRQILEVFPEMATESIWHGLVSA
jgi:hypothetical protein